MCTIFGSMISKVLFCFAILALVRDQYASDASRRGDRDYSSNCSSVSEIQRDSIREMIRNSHELWKSTPVIYNIMIFPLSETIEKTITFIFKYYTLDLDSIISKKRFLEVAYELSRLTITMGKFLDMEQKTAILVHPNDSWINFTNEVFIDIYPRGNWIPTLENSNNNEPQKNIIISWLSEHTRGRKPQNEKFMESNSTHFLESALSFYGCWNVTSLVPIEMVYFKLHDRKYPNYGVTVPMFWYIQKVPYAYDEILNYESIELRYSYMPFAMLIVLPRVGQQFDLFVANLTIDDYNKILEPKNVTENLRISYSIPQLDLDMVKITQDGTNINHKDMGYCSPANQLTQDEMKNVDIRFIVDRPFGVFIFHKATKIVIFQSWIRDPTSTHYVHHINSEKLNKEYEKLIESKRPKEAADGITMTPDPNSKKYE